MKASTYLLLGTILACASPAQAGEGDAIQQYWIQAAPLHMSGQDEPGRVGDPAAKAGQAEIQHYQIQAMPLRMSGRGEQNRVGDPIAKAGQGDVQQYRVQAAPLRMSGRGEQSRVGDPIAKAGQGDVQQYRVQAAPLSMSGRGDAIGLGAQAGEPQSVYTITTGKLEMTGRRPQDMAITTGALSMTGRRPQSMMIATGKLEMTGRRTGAAANTQVNTSGNALQVQPPRPVFRLLRVVPLGAAGTNPFDFRDVRTDVAVALAGGSVAPTPGGGSGSVTPPEPVVPTALTLLGGLPPFEVKAGEPALIQVDTAAQTLSVLYNGAPQAVTPSTALSFSLNLIAFGNVTARLDEVAPWSVASRDYPQPFDTSRTTCTVLRHTDGTHYKILLGVTEGNTGYLMNSLSGTHHDTTAPSCP